VSEQSEQVHYRRDDKVAIIHLDDGKANAYTPDVLDAVSEALDRAAREARAVLIQGRPGRFSAGFDLARMTASAESAQSLVTQGAELLLKVYMHPQPVVAACTGHALAAGALMLLVADTRIGAAGQFKIGLNEVAIGLRLPIFAVELARDRLSKRHFVASTIQGRSYTPEEARDVGFLDQVVDAGAVEETALAAARALADLPTGALSATKELARRYMVDGVRRGLADDMARLAPPSNTGNS